MTHHYSPTSPLDAIYTAMRKYPGGVEALGVRLGKKPDTFRQEVSPRVSSHKLGFDDALHALEILQAENVHDWQQVVHAINYRFSHIAVPLPESPEETSDEHLMQTVLRVMKEQGDVANAITEATPGGISPREMATIEAEFEQALAAMTLLLDRVRRRSRSTATVHPIGGKRA